MPSNLIDDRPTLAELERRYIELVLRETGNNKKRTAELLGIDRRTLNRSLERGGRTERDDKEPDDVTHDEPRAPEPPPGRAVEKAPR